MAQKDQFSIAPAMTTTRPRYLPQETLQYKTFLKRTIQEALQNAFRSYRDTTLSKTKISVDYQTERSNYPNVVVKFYERSLKNAGVGHMEWGRTDELEKLTAKNIKVNKSKFELSNLASTEKFFTGKTRVKGKSIPKGTVVHTIIDNHSVTLNQEPLADEEKAEVHFEDLVGEKYIEYRHYIYEGDISLEIYGLSSADRDKVVDALIEVVAMGPTGPHGTSFQERIYESVGSSEYPFAKWHFIAVNTDLLNDYGEQHMLAPWMAEDTWLYKNERRFPVLGEFYNIQPLPLEGALALLDEVDLHPWEELSGNTIATGENKEAHLLNPAEYPNEVIPEEDVIKITKEKPFVPSSRTKLLEAELGPSSTLAGH